MEADKIIETLKNMDLTTNPYNEVKSLLKKFGSFLISEHCFHKRKQFMRGRLNDNYEGRFNKKSELSFNPHQPTKYQRASTLNQSMFYACSLSDKPTKEEIKSLRIPCVMENIYKELNDNNTSFYKKMTFGRWKVVEDLKVVALILDDNLLRETSYTKEIVENYKKLYNYLVSEFSKMNIDNHYDYMISAIFTEIVTELGFDGVIYSSVRTQGKSLNIAITPKATEKLQLIAVTECSLYKHKENTECGNDALAYPINSDNFQLKQEPDFFNNQNVLMKKLGFNSFNDFKHYCDRK